MKYDLLPCPFCGSRNLDMAPARRIGGYVYCNDCNTSGPDAHTTGDEREAVTLWNQRLDGEREPEE